jgi:hypothetical protein
VTTHAQAAKRSRRSRLAFATTLAIAAGLATASPASAGSGGTGIDPAPVPGSQAELVGGLAVAPQDAPQQVKDVIDAANHIAKGKGYCLGGGHGSWNSKCYDCSGAVSYALHGGGLLNYPLASSGFYGWGHRGRGSWISVYANGGHAFMTVAGLRFDTSDTRGPGPGWAQTMGYENPRSYQKRHRIGF